MKDKKLRKDFNYLLFYLGATTDGEPVGDGGMCDLSGIENIKYLRRRVTSLEKLLYLLLDYLEIEEFENNEKGLRKKSKK